MTNPADRARDTELSALKLAVAVAENYARNGSAESLHRLLCEALTAVREAALREAWVPCSERMPEPGERVLVVLESGSVAACRKGGPYDNEWIQFGWNQKGVTHWMKQPPPPPPPKGTP